MTKPGIPGTGNTESGNNRTRVVRVRCMPMRLGGANRWWSTWPTKSSNRGVLAASPKPSWADSIDSDSGKRKRRQWSVKENLFALDALDQNAGNKRLTADQHEYTRYQLRQWKKSKIDLKTLFKINHRDESLFFQIAHLFVEKLWNMDRFLCGYWLNQKQRLLAC
jgi:hypothetical protein